MFNLLLFVVNAVPRMLSPISFARDVYARLQITINQMENGYTICFTDFDTNSI